MVHRQWTELSDCGSRIDVSVEWSVATSGVDFCTGLNHNEFSLVEGMASFTKLALILLIESHATMQL